VTTMLLLVFALTAASFPAGIDAIVLTSGHVIPVAGEPEVVGRSVRFSDDAGRLYSVRLDAVDVDATAERARRAAARQEEAAGRGRLAVTAEEKERLLLELQKSRGTPAPPQEELPALAPVERRRPAPPSIDERREWEWRERAQQYEERVRIARENLQATVEREQRLQDQIRGLIGLGYEANQFSYQVLQLERTRAAIEPAKLELDRAERALAQFRDNARRQGIPPGWLR
jgi:hypothetical protein